MGRAKKPDPGPASRYIGQRLTTELNNQDRPQAWLARQTGIPASTLGRLLRGLDTWFVDQMIECARVLHVDAADLVREAAQHDDHDADLRGYIDGDSLTQIDDLDPDPTTEGHESA